MHDPIADLLIRIKNAYLAGHEEVRVPFSKMKEAIAQLLLAEGYLEKVETIERELLLRLRYLQNQPSLSGIKQLSKPSRRLYSSAQQIPKALGGYGVTILSTNQGIMSDRDARKKNLGGELICQIW